VQFKIKGGQVKGSSYCGDNKNVKLLIPTKEAYQEYPKRALFMCKAREQTKLKKILLKQKGNFKSFLERNFGSQEKNILRAVGMAWIWCLGLCRGWFGGRGV
jgi:hypothetical protein